MKKTTIQFCIGILALFIFSGSSTVGAQEVENSIYIQGMLGMMKLDQGDLTFQEEDNPDESVVLKGESKNLPYFGFAIQQVLGGERFKSGLEGGLMGSWKNDKRKVTISSDGTAYVQIKSSRFLGDLFFGGFTSMELGNRVRVYLGGGPLLIYGQREVDADEYDNSSDEVIIKYDNEYESEWNVGLYARTGIDFILTDEFILGLSARHIETNLEFDDGGRTTRIEGTQFLFTFTAAFSGYDSLL